MQKKSDIEGISNNVYNQNGIKQYYIKKSANGITLVAMIITVIVMLILVGVTINIAAS